MSFPDPAALDADPTALLLPSNRAVGLYTADPLQTAAAGRPGPPQNAQLSPTGTHILHLITTEALKEQKSCPQP